MTVKKTIDIHRDGNLDPVNIDDLVHRDDEKIMMSFDGLKELARRFSAQAGYAFSRKFIHVNDIKDGMEETSRHVAVQLTTDIKDIIDADDAPVRCDCGNDTDFSVFVSRIHLTLENGREIKDIQLEHHDRFTKPDTIVIICDACDKVVVESCVP